MCYDISFKTKLDELSNYFPDLVIDDQIDIKFDRDHIVAHAYGNHPIIYQNRDDNKLHLKLMEWGCIPFYVKDEKTFVKQRSTMLNARSERILDDPKSYWYKIRNRRCLIPLTGTFEHRHVVGWTKKVPYFVKPKDQKMFFLPGLYSVVELPDLSTGELIKRYTWTLITRNANDVMKNIHNDGDNRWRMPLYLPFGMSREYIGESVTEDRYRAILGYEMPSEDIEYYTVDTIRSPKPRGDQQSKDMIFEWPRLPALGEGNPN
jgi:putative SOS response-associated peptidase YedK